MDEHRTALRQARPGRVGWAATLAASLLLMGLMHGPRARAATPGEVAVGQVLRDATLVGLNGPSRPLSVYRGKPLIINVWASWCGPCRQELASLERLAWSEAAGPFAIIGISTDDYPEQARALLTQAHATISHFIDRNLLMENMLGATHLPLTVLVDENGRVLEKIYGSRQWDDAESLRLIRSRFAAARKAPPRSAGSPR